MVTDPRRRPCGLHGDSAVQLRDSVADVVAQVLGQLGEDELDLVAASASW